MRPSGIGFRVACVLAALLLISVTLVTVILVALLAIGLVLTMALFFWCLCKFFPAFSPHVPPFMQLAARTLTAFAMKHVQAALTSQDRTPTGTRTASTNIEETGNSYSTPTNYSSTNAQESRDTLTTTTTPGTNFGVKQLGDRALAKQNDSMIDDMTSNHMKALAASTNTDETENDSFIEHDSLIISSPSKLDDTSSTTEERNNDFGVKELGGYSWVKLTSIMPDSTTNEDMKHSSPDEDEAYDTTSSPDVSEESHVSVADDDVSLKSGGCDVTDPTQEDMANQGTSMQTCAEQDTGDQGVCITEAPVILDPCEEENPNASREFVLGHGATFAMPLQDMGGGGTSSSYFLHTQWEEQDQSQLDSWMTSPYEEDNDDPGALSVLVVGQEWSGWFYSKAPFV